MSFPGKVFLDCAGTYKPGDLPPEGYLQWHEWAEVQRLAQIKQVECVLCGLWRTPQELSGKFQITQAKDAGGEPITIETPICTKCAEPSGAQNPKNTKP